MEPDLLFKSRFVLMFKATSLCALLATVAYWGMPLAGPFALAAWQGLIGLLRAAFTVEPMLPAAVLSLLVGMTHYRFWSRAKWNGSNWSEAAMPRDVVPALHIGSVAAVFGGGFLLAALVARADARSWLETLLGLLALLPIGLILAHKLRMLSQARLLEQAHSGGPADRPGRVNDMPEGVLAGIVVIAIFFAGAFQHTILLCTPLGLALYAALVLLRLPVLGPASTSAEGAATDGGCAAHT